MYRTCRRPTATRRKVVELVESLWDVTGAHRKSAACRGSNVANCFGEQRAVLQGVSTIPPLRNKKWRTDCEQTSDI